MLRRDGKGYIAMASHEHAIRLLARSLWVLELNWTSHLLGCIYRMALHGVWSFELGDTGVLLRLKVCPVSYHIAYVHQSEKHPVNEYSSCHILYTITRQGRYLANFSFPLLFYAHSFSSRNKGISSRPIFGSRRQNDKVTKGLKQ